MTTELTKAAQQALDRLDALAEPTNGLLAVPENSATVSAIQADLSLIRAALTQQATTERHLTVTTNQQGDAVMVSWQDDEHRILEVVWEREQATPEPLIVKGAMAGMVDAQVRDLWPTKGATPEPVPDQNTIKKSTPEPSRGCIACAARDAAIGHPPCADVPQAYLEWLATKSRSAGVGGNEAWNAGVEWQKRQPPQQAAGEPVHQIRGDAFECPHAWRDATEEAFYTTPAADRRILYTRPAPGVPEGFAMVPVEPTPKVAMVLYEGARNCFSPKVAEGLWQDALAAAQAKGEQE